MVFFLNKNVVTFWTRVFDFPFKNLKFKIFIIIFILNLKISNCILILSKEGFNNSHKKPINNCLVSNISSTHLKNLDKNKERDCFLHKNVIYKNTKYNKIVYKIRDSNKYYFISNRCVTRSAQLDKISKLSELFIRFESKFDLKSNNSNNELDSGSYYSTHTVVSDPEPIAGLEYPNYESRNLIKKSTNLNKTGFLNYLKNSQSSKQFGLSDIDIGLIKNVNCDRVIDVKSIFDDIYPQDESNKRYGLYKDNLVKFLADELRYGLFNRTLDLLYNRWKKMDAVALSRGFRVLFTDLAVKKKFYRIVEIFLQILPNRFATDIYCFEMAARSIERVFVDGWVLSLVLISVMKSFGIELFKRVPAFKDFKSSINLDIFKGAKSWFDRHYIIELHDTHNLRLSSMDSLYNTSIYSCFDSRNFSILLSLFYEKLMMKNAINSYLSVDYKPKLNEKETENLNNVPHLGENESYRSFDSTLNSCLSILSNKNVSYDLNLIEKEILSMKESNINQYSDNDWSIYVILKHSLNNIYSTNELVLTNSNDVKIYNEDNTSDSNTSPADLEQEQKTKLKELLKSRNNLSKLEKWTEKFYSTISNKELFFKNSIYTRFVYTLEKTIDDIREYVSSGKDIGVSEIYGFLRNLLKHKISGSTAFNLLFMLIPNLTFLKRLHYHMFACCLEHDFEQGNLNSIDELLEYMVKLDCNPGPGLYDRFFELCNSQDKALMVLKHFKIMSENNINWNRWDRYTSERKIRISFGMYEQILISCIKTGKIKDAMKALLHLLGVIKGTYKSIPATIWNTFIKAIESCKIDKELKGIIDQFSKNSENNPPDMTKQIYIEIPKHKSALINEIERILENYINNDN